MSKMRVNNGHVVLKMQGFLISKRKKKALLLLSCYNIGLQSTTFWRLFELPCMGTCGSRFRFSSQVYYSFGCFNIEDPQRCFKTSRLQLVRISFVSVVKLRKTTS